MTRETPRAETKNKTKRVFSNTIRTLATQQELRAVKKLRNTSKTPWKRALSCLEKNKYANKELSRDHSP